MILHVDVTKQSYFLQGEPDALEEFLKKYGKNQKANGLDVHWACRREVLVLCLVAHVFSHTNLVSTSLPHVQCSLLVCLCSIPGFLSVFRKSTIGYIRRANEDDDRSGTISEKKTIYNRNTDKHGFLHDPSSLVACCFLSTLKHHPDRIQTNERAEQLQEYDVPKIARVQEILQKIVGGARLEWAGWGLSSITKQG